MISLDQVYLLEQKVESAVEKIQQLQAENDALRSKCDELTNALSAKSEQLSSFESDQSQIESGIKKALDRLNSIENSVLRTATQINQAAQAAKPAVQESKPAVQAAPAPQAEEADPAEAPVQSAPVQNQPVQDETVENAPSFDTMDTVEEEIDTPEDDNQDGLGFDIF
jgi:chromosome segregation ATPase